MPLRLSRPSTLVALFTTLVSYSAWAVAHTVSEGENLSVLVAHFVKGPVWGSQGGVARVLNLNPKLKTHPNLIIADDTIELPEEQTPLASLADLNRKVADVEETSPAPVFSPASEREVPSTVVTKASPMSPSVRAQVSLADTEFQQHSLVSISPELYFSRIDSQDRTSGATSSLGSNVNAGINLSWKLFLSSKIETDLGLGIASESYYTSGTQRSLDHSSLILGDATIRTYFGNDNGVKLITEIGIGQDPFVRGESISQNTIDSVTIPRAGLGLSLPLMSSSIFSLRLNGTGDYLAPAHEDSYSVLNGYAAQGSLSISQTASAQAKQMQAAIFYSYTNQSTSLTRQSEKALGLSLQWSFDYFRKED